MAAYHQMGHDSKNLLDETELDIYAGAILSPVNYAESEVRHHVGIYQAPHFEMIFDPQLYYPRTLRGELASWSYFPQDVDTADISSDAWWGSLLDDISATVRVMGCKGMCSPAMVPRAYTDEYFELLARCGHEAKVRLEGDGIEVIQTVIVRPADLTTPHRANEVASIISSAGLSRIYLVFDTEVDPRREISQVDDLKAAMRLIRIFTNAGIAVIVGFTSSELLLWKFAGASACCTGKFFNIRRFTKSRFDPPGRGGGQIPYWFEEKLLAFIREADFIRLRNIGLVSNMGEANPFGPRIAEKIDASPPKPWIADSWRQYMYWFADFERRFTQGLIDANAFLRSADENWSKVERANILMEERANDGAWVRSWRQAAMGFEE